MKKQRFNLGGGAPTKVEERLFSRCCAAGGGGRGAMRPLICDWLCSCSKSKIDHRGWAKCTLIFILRKHNWGILSTGVFRQHPMNRCGCQRYRLRSKRLEILGWCWLAPQAIGGEEKLVVNEIKQFHSRETWLLIIDDLGEVSIIKQQLLNLDPKFSLRAHIQPVTSDNSSRCPICQQSGNGTNLQFQLCIFSGVVNIRKCDRGALTTIQDSQLLVFADQFWEVDHQAIDTQMVYIQVHLLMPA